MKEAIIGKFCLPLIASCYQEIMNSFKCPECNLTNWATATECKRCRCLFQTVSAETSPMPETFGEQDFVGANQNAPQNFQTPRFEPQINRSSEQNYQRQNYRQPSYQYNQPANLKTGLAIASMVLGISGFVTSIF